MQDPLLERQQVTTRGKDTVTTHLHRMEAPMRPRAEITRDLQYAYNQMRWANAEIMAVKPLAQDMSDLRRYLDEIDRAAAKHQEWSATYRHLSAELGRMAAKEMAR